MVPTIATWELRGQATLQHCMYIEGGEVQWNSTIRYTSEHVLEKSPLLGGNLIKVVSLVTRLPLSQG